MKLCHSWCQRVCVAWTLFCATSPLMLMAQQAPEKEEAAASPWVMSYMMFTLAVFLGIFVTCMPSKRAEKPKFDD